MTAMCIISEFKANNANALKVMFDRYHQAVFNYVFDKTKSEYYAREVVQLSFIKLWKYRDKISEDIDVSNLLFRIVRTTMIDEIRKDKVMQKHYENYEASFTNEEPIEFVYYHDTLKKLEKLIAKMPPVRQSVFRLSRFNNYTYKEIAEQLSIAPKTVENHINLALKFIRPYFPFIILLIQSIFYL